jgi:hypothetical protein
MDVLLCREDPLELRGLDDGDDAVAPLLLSGLEVGTDAIELAVVPARPVGLFQGKCSARLRRHPRVALEELHESVDY